MRLPILFPVSYKKMITKKDFWNHEKWGDFAKTCEFKCLEKFHWPPDNPNDACCHPNVYGPCCFTACLGWLHQLSDLDRADVLAEMDEAQREYEAQKVSDGI